MRLVTGLKDEKLAVLLMREDMLLAMLPGQLVPREAAGDGDRGLERGRLLAQVFDKVTAAADAEVQLLQARDMLGLCGADPGWQDRLKAADPRGPRQPAKPADLRAIGTRLGLAASRDGSSERAVRRHAGGILRSLLTAVDEFGHDEGAVQALAAQIRARRAPGAADPLDAPEVRRVMRLCAQFSRELDQAFDAVSGPASFGTGLYVIRGVQEDLLDRVTGQAEPGKAIAVVGEAGYGKTSLLWGLHRDLTGHAPFLPLLVSAAWLRAQQPGSGPVLTGEDLVGTVAALDRSGTTPVVLLDTMDLLLHEEDESVRAIDLIDEVRAAGARVVVTCREQEARGLGRHFEPVRLAAYDEAELPAAIGQHVLAFCPDAPPQPAGEKVSVMLRLASRGLGMTDVCHHPLFLRLLFEAYAGSFPSEEVDPLGVLAAYFGQKICDDVRGRANPDVARDDVHVECFCLAIALFSAGAVALPRDELLLRARRVAAAWDRARQDTLPHALDLLIRRSVLLADSPDGIRFRHQLLFEYLAARALIERGGAAEVRRLLGIVTERPLDLFTGAVFEQAMIYAWGASRTLRPDLTAVLAALAESPSVNLQSMALVVAAYHPGIEAGVAGLLNRAGPETVRRFVELTPRVSGRQIGRALMLLRRVWEDGDPLCRRAVLNVLERFALQHGQAVKDFIVDLQCVEHVVTVKGDLLLSQRALPRTLGLLAETDAAWSTEALLSVFEAGCQTTSRRAVAVAILEIAAGRWAYLGSARTLARYTLAACRAQRRNGGQDAAAVRLAGGRLFACYWADRYRLERPEPLAGEWLELAGAVRRRLAASPQAPLRVQMQLMGMAQALTRLPEGHPLIAPTLTRLFPPADDSYGLPVLELPDSFLVPLLRSASPAGYLTRALIKDALAGLPADPARTDDPASLRASAARMAVTSAGLSASELASLLDGLPSLREPGQWIDPGGVIALVIPAALGGHPVARAALDKIAAEPALVGAPGRRNVTYALTRSLGEHPGLIPQALAICAAWRTAVPFTEAIRRHGQTFTRQLAKYPAGLDMLVHDLFAAGGEAQQDAVNLWLEVDALDILPPRSFAELRSAWLAASVLTVKQNILRLMGMQAGRGLIPLDEVTELMRSLVIVERSGLRAGGGRFTDYGTLEAARDALVTALALAGPLTQEGLDDLLSLATDRTARRDTQIWLRLPLSRLAESGRAAEAFDFYARIAELTADRGTSHQNKLANKLHGVLLTVCENADSAEHTRQVRALPELPVQFAQILVRALVRMAYDNVHDPLQELAAQNRLSGLVALTIKNELARHSRLSGSLVMDDLLVRPNG